MKELLNNPLIEHFKIVEKDTAVETETNFILPNEVLDTLANSATNMLDVNIENEEAIDADEDEDDNLTEEDSQVNVQSTLYCPACTTDTPHHGAYGCFRIVHMNYEHKSVKK